MLEKSLSAQLQSHLEKIVHPIELVATLDDSPKSVELRVLLEEIESLSDQVSLATNGDEQRKPSFRIRRIGSEEKVTVGFAGIPLGHEFTSLVLALLQVGGHPSTASADLITQIESIEGEYHFETFFSLSCQNCPDVVQALNLMSVLNPSISHTAIDGALFQTEVDERNILAVPTVFLNGETFDQGRMSLEQIVAQLDSDLANRQASEIDAKDDFDILVLGGGPAGSAAAVYAARKGIRTGVVAERFGGQLQDTMGIENLISLDYTEGPKLAAALEQNVRNHDVDIMHLQRAKRLVPSQRTGGSIEIELESGATVRSRAVVVSTGARWRKMNVPGEAEYANRGVAYCPHCDGPLFKGKRVAVVGGGNSGVEAAIDLAGIVGHVTVVEFDTALRADRILQEKLSELPNVEVVTNAATTQVLGDGERVNGLVYKDRDSDVEHTVELEGVFVQIGLLPNTEWLEGTIELSDRGEIMVDTKGQTSVAGVFAAGDCTTVPYKQIAIALGSGSTAVLGAFDYLIRTSPPVAAAS